MRSRHISDQEIEDGLAMLACLIEWYGDVYWPIFDRLENELERRRLRSAQLRARLPVSHRAGVVSRGLADGRVGCAIVNSTTGGETR